MKRFIPITLWIVFCVSLVLVALRLGRSPIQMSQDGKTWTTIKPISRAEKTAYIIHCEKGQLFRICSTKPTLITGFAPDGHGLAIIRFEYTK